MAFDTKTVELRAENMVFLGEDEFDWSEKHVKAAVKLAFDNTELNEQKGFKNFACVEIFPENVISKVAYIESSSGYFFVSAGFLDDFVVTYHRWD